MDERIVDIAVMVKSMGFKQIFLASNADFLTPELAQGLDGVVSYIGFAFYMGEPNLTPRMAWVKSLFKKTRLSLAPGAPEDQHMVTHFSPIADVIQLGRQHQNNRCVRPLRRMIVNHRGDMLLCCDDLIGHYDLGSIHQSTIEELWYSEKHQHLVRELMNPGGRKVHPHCLNCPRD